MTRPGRHPFRSLRNPDYRVWIAGSFASSVGTWVQMTAQDWLVLTRLTAHDASALGLVMALQFGPQVLLLPWTGTAADHLDQRRLLIATQAAMGTLALVLGLLTVSGRVALWHVYAFAFLSGCAAAFDAPVRQTFVARLVGDDLLPNAVALNSTAFNAARMIGPAVSGLLIATTGTGCAFILNGASFGAVLVSLLRLRGSDAQERTHRRRRAGGMMDGVRHVWSAADLRATLIMLALVGTFGLNFPIFISTMAVGVLRTDARGFGLLSSALACGTLAGAFAGAASGKPRFGLLPATAGIFGLGCTAAALAPGYWSFAAALAATGVSILLFTNATNSLMQLGTPPDLRGRVMALRIGIALGGTPIGAPIVGAVADTLGPRWGLGVGAAAGLLAAAVGCLALWDGSRAASAAG